MRINHNIPALKSNNQLGRTNSKLDKSLERLSSGNRINKAGDDAAGLAISQKMRTQISGLDQATRNAADGISVIQTAEGALNEVHDMLQRMRELAVQSANGTNNDDDRLAIQAEIGQLNEEITRIGNTTEFNTKKLLNGNIDRKSYSSDNTVELISLSDTVGVGVYSIEITAIARKAQVTTLTATAGDASGTIDADGKVTDKGEGKLFVNGEEITIKEGDDADAIFEKIRNLCDKVNVTLTAIDSSGEPTLFTWGQSLVITNDEYGSSKNVEIHADGGVMALLNLTTSKNTTDIDDLSTAGLTTAPDSWDVTAAGANIKGMDAKANLVLNRNDPNSLFKETSTVSSDGTILRISDKNGFEIKFDIGEKYSVDSIDVIAQAMSDASVAALADLDAVLDTLTSEDGSAGLTTLGDIVNLRTAIDDAITAIDDEITTPSDPSILDTLLEDLSTAFNDLSEEISTLVGIGATTGINSSTEALALAAVKTANAAINSANPNNVSVALLSSGPMVLQIGANQYQTMDVRIPELTPKTLGVDKVNLTTSDGAQEAISMIDNAINTVSSIRSKLGAYYNRLEHSINNLEVGSENLTEALSRISDADMAKEMATYTQRNVLAQAGTSMLAQANQRPQTILQLLQ